MELEHNEGEPENFEKNDQIEENQLLRELRELLRQNEIDEGDFPQFFQYFNQNLYEECFKLVKKKKRDSFIEKFNQILKQNGKQVQEKIQEEVSVKELVNTVLKNFEIKGEEFEEVFELFEEGKIDECLLYVKKNKREQLKNSLEEIKSKISLNGQNTNKSAMLRKKLYQCFGEVNLDSEEFEDYHKLISQGKIQEVSRQVRLNKREIFNQKIREILNEFGSKEKIQKKKILIKFSETLRQIQYLAPQNLKDKIQEEFGIIHPHEFQIVLDGKNSQETSEFFRQPQIKGRILQLYSKKKKYYSFNGQLFTIWLSKNISGKSIYKKLLQMLRKNDESIEEIYLTFKMQKNTLENISNLQIDEIRSGQLKEIVVQAPVTVIVHYNNIKRVYRMKDSNTILDLRKNIDKDLLPFEAQSIFYENQTRIHLKREFNHNLIREIIGESRVWNIELRDTHTVEFYGFHANRTKTYGEFSEFFVESEEEIIELINNSNFDQRNLESLFFEKFIKYVYSGIKKRFPIQTTIEKFKQLTVMCKSRNLWMPIDDSPVTMNQYFLAMYLLYNSEEKLRITLMKLIYKLLPLPMYFRKFENILNVSDEIFKNQDLGWVLKEGITILSVGLHNPESSQYQKGKSSFLNTIFFTNFVNHKNRHKILQKLPYISIGVYDEIFPLNIIDIPYDCPTEIVHSLAEYVDIIIFHSWLSEYETQKVKTEIEKEYDIKGLVLMRDLHVNEQNHLKELKKRNFAENDTILLPNLSNEEKSKSIFKLLRQQFHLFFKFIHQKKRYDRIMKFSVGLMLRDISKNLDILTKKKNEEILKFVAHRNLRSNFKGMKIQQSIRNLVSSGLDETISQLLNDLSRQNSSIEICLDFFRQKLRDFQSGQTSKFMKIYKIKETLKNFQNIEEQDQIDFLNQIHQNLLQLPEIYHQQKYIIGKKIDEIEEIFEEITFEFENKIRPTIYSVELFWRQIYGYLEMAKGIISEEEHEKFLNEVAEIKKKQILNNQPFEIIDGDSFKMPKQVMEQVFKPITDRCLVVTILGPQSSGKSTLLNFLFGCDFATSEGRCTRGVYGTYFKVQDKRIINFDGIFVIDTEGLFALTNEKDSQQKNRENFDSKLVLFCLAVSDIVIINVRGNLDFNTQRIMRICNEKLEALNKSQETKPQIIIVLNQNSTSKTQQSENEFKKIRNTFSFKIAKSLSMAYVIKNFGKDEISLFSQNQILTKKTPLPHFRKETTNLLKQILALMKQKSTAEKMVHKIQKFFRVWSTVLAFPNLSKMKSKEYLELQNEIKGWKKQELLNIEQFERELMDKIKNDLIEQKKGEIQLEKINQKYLNSFKQVFYVHNIQTELISLIKDEEREIQNQNENRMNRLKYNISQNNFRKQLEKQKFEGDFLLKEKQNEIIQNQNQNKKQYTLKDKQEIFNLCFEEVLTKIKKSIKIEEKCKEEEERIRNQYDYCLKANTSKMRSLGMLKENFQFERSDWLKLDFQTVYQKLSREFCQPLQFQELLQYNEKPHTNVLHGGQRDAKLKYFDTRKYFKWTQRYRYHSCSLRKLSQCFNDMPFLENFRKVLDKQKEDNGERKKLKEIYEELKKNFAKDFNLVLGDFSNFVDVFQNKKKEGLWKKIMRIIGHFYDPKLKICKNKPQKISESQHRNLSQKYKYNQLFQDNIVSQIFEKTTIAIKDQKKPLFQLKMANIIAEQIESGIRWGKIADIVRFSPKNKNLRQNCIPSEREKLRIQLNQDLQKINLYLPDNISLTQIIKQSLQKGQDRSYRFLDSKKSGEIIFDKIFYHSQAIQKDGPIMDSRRLQEKLKGWSHFKYFSGRKLRQNLKISQHPDSNKSDIIVGVFEEEYLEPINDKFEKYQESNYVSLKQQFQSFEFKKFIFTELENLHSIKNLSNEIKQIILKAKNKWGKLQGKAIAEIYRSVNEEITKFNDDLNQVSYQLSFTMMGKLHLLTIYLIEKCQTDSIHKKQNEIIDKKLKMRETQLKRFLMRTSNDLNQQIEQQIISFQQKLFEIFLKMVSQNKEKLFAQNIKKFNMQYSRKEIQREIDFEIFQRQTDPEEVLKYLEEPAKFLSEKYQNVYEQFWGNLERGYLKKNIDEIIVKDLQKIISTLYFYLTEKQNVTLEKGRAHDLFSIQNGVPGEHDYDEQSKKVLFEYFMDRLCKSNPDKTRKCIDLTLKPKTQSIMLPVMEQITQNILQKIHGSQLKITNLPVFINKLLSDSSKEKIREEMKTVFELNDEQKKNFINSVRVIICPEKCPCCGRICGLEQQTHDFHKCVFGHQMRALAGNYIKNSEGEREAFVVSCDQMEETDIMEYNGNQYTWTEFKDYWANKPVGSWKYDDTNKKKDKIDKQRIKNAWLKAGPIFCSKNNLVYVDYTDSSKQKQSICQDIHFIFALDTSGSMAGNKWNQLIQAFRNTIQKIQESAAGNGKRFISVITFNQNYQKIYSRVHPFDVDVDSILYRNGCTSFQPVFEEVSSLARRWINEETIVFIFMTDGAAGYPNKEIQKIKDISDNNPKRFFYYGIQFECNTTVMKNIRMALDGKNQIADNFEELVAAFSQAIQIIAHKQKPVYGMMEPN